MQTILDQANIDTKAHPELNLNTWKDEWLCTAGLNEVLPEWNPQGNSATEVIKIHQSASLAQHPTLRYHKIKVAFFNDAGEIYKTEEHVINNTKVTEIKSDFSQNKPAAILLNYGEEAYQKILLDEASLDFFLKNLSKIRDDITRIQIWITLWSMVRDGKMSGVDYCLAAWENLQTETLPDVISTMLRYSEAAIHSLIPRDITKKYKLREKIFDRVKSLMSDGTKDSERGTLLKEFLISFASTEENYATLAQWLEGKLEDLSYIDIGKDSKWSILVKLYRSHNISSEKKTEYLNKLAKEDNSDAAVKTRRRVEAMVADESKRADLWRSFFDQTNKDSVNLIEASMSGLNDITNVEKTEKFYDEYFAKLVNVYNTREKEYANAFYDNLFPRHERLDEIVIKFQKVQQECPEGSVWLSRKLKETLDDLNRKKRAFACVASNTKAKA